MTRYFMGLVLVLALGVMGCSETAGTGGSAGDGGSGGDGGAAGVGGDAGHGGGGAGGSPPLCVDNVCACTEAGIRAAIAEGGGPFTFDCDGPTTLEVRILIDNDVALDGGGDLTLVHHLAGVASREATVAVTEGTTAELRGFGVTTSGGCGTAVENEGTLTVMESVVSGELSDDGRCPPIGIHNLPDATLEVAGSTIAGFDVWCVGRESDGPCGTGVWNYGDAKVSGSAISANFSGVFNFAGTFEAVNTTVSGNSIWSETGATMRFVGCTLFDASLHDNNSPKKTTIANSIVVGPCSSDNLISGGYNIESPGDTCGFDQPTDQVNVSADDLKLGDLADNGGPTMTHALGVGSVAIDQIPEAQCVDADDEPLTTDQRGEPRDNMCDVGAVEMEVTP